MEWRRIVEEDRRRRVTTGKSGYPPPLDFNLVGEVERRELEKIKEFAGIQSDLTIDSYEKHFEYRPEEVVRRISPRPIFFATTETSVVVPTDETIAFYEKAKEPKKPWVVPASTAGSRLGTHMSGHGYAELIAKAFLDRFKKWIPP
jgi:hypothetical protein